MNVKPSFITAPLLVALCAVAAIVGCGAGQNGAEADAIGSSSKTKTATCTLAAGALGAFPLGAVLAAPVGAEDADSSAARVLKRNVRDAPRSRDPAVGWVKGASNASRTTFYHRSSRSQVDWLFESVKDGDRWVKGQSRVCLPVRYSKKTVYMPFQLGTGTKASAATEAQNASPKVTLSSGSIDGEPRVKIEESDARVKVTVVGTPLSGDAPAVSPNRTVELALEAPIGNRELIDGSFVPDRELYPSRFDGPSSIRKLLR